LLITEDLETDMLEIDGELILETELLGYDGLLVDTATADNEPKLNPEPELGNIDGEGWVTGIDVLKTSTDALLGAKKPFPYEASYLFILVTISIFPDFSPSSLITAIPLGLSFINLWKGAFEPQGFTSTLLAVKAEACSGN
jgi:hypothetical protein